MTREFLIDIATKILRENGYLVKKRTYYHAYLSESSFLAKPLCSDANVIVMDFYTHYTSIKATQNLQQKVRLYNSANDQECIGILYTANVSRLAKTYIDIIKDRELIYAVSTPYELSSLMRRIRYREIIIL
jgi:hypothetical protein